MGFFLSESTKRMKKFAFEGMMNLVEDQGNDGIVNKPLLDGVMALNPAILTHLDLLGIMIGMSPAFNSFLQGCNNLSLLKLKKAAILTQALLVGLFEALWKKLLVSLALTACGGNIEDNKVFWRKLMPFLDDFPPTLELLNLKDMALTNSFFSVAFVSLLGKTTALRTLSVRKNPLLTTEALWVIYHCSINKLQALHVTGAGIT
jgi:hypothetical protein